MNVARIMFEKIPGDIEKTLEGIPQLFNREKVFAIRDAGFNRVSMGVQQMSDRLIRYSGRKQTRKQVLDALETLTRPVSLSTWTSSTGGQSRQPTTC